MGKIPIGFDHPVYVTRPIFPNLDDLQTKLRDIWESGWLTNGGAQHSELERQLGNFLKTDHLSLFNNGTIALIVACQALRLQGEVITTPFTFPATPHVLSWNNLTPVFCDIQKDTMNIDPTKIEALITSRTSAILGVHVYGIPCDVHAIQRIANRHGLRVVYDAAHAFSTEYEGAPIVSFGDASMLSFHSTKLFHTAEGGALVVRDVETKRRVDHLKNFGIEDEQTILMPGLNGKMNEIQAALGLLTLSMVDAEQRRRAEIAKIYRARLADINTIDIPGISQQGRQSQQYFVIRVHGSGSYNPRDQLHLSLKKYNIFTRKYFYPLCSSYSCYAMLPSAEKSKLSNAHWVSERVLCLPFHGDLSDEEIHRICDAIEYEIELR